MVRVAVVGCGYWGPNLIRNFQHLDECELTMCCDLDPGRLAPISRLYPTVRTTTSYQEVLSSPEVDAVVLATPALTHVSLGKQALLAGKHVLMEKPLALTSNGCEELIALADSNQRVLMVGHTYLFSPAVLKLKEMMDPEYLGDMYYMYSHRMNLGRIQTDINALWSIAPHDISIALFLLDQLPLEVSARGASYLSDSIEDVVFLTMTFPQGSIAHCHVSWVDPSKVRKVTLIGSKRMIVFDDLADEGKIKVYDKGVIKGGNGNIYGEFHYRLHSGDIYSPQLPMTEPLAKECAHFIECIQKGTRPVSDGLNGLQVVRVLEAAQRSLENRGITVEVPWESAVLV